MNRLQKKCFLFSVAIHGSLGVIVLIGAAFRPSPKQNDLQVMTLIPARLLDRAGSGGGSMGMAIAPQPQREPQPRPQPPAQPKPRVEPPQELPPKPPTTVERIREMVERLRPREPEKAEVPVRRQREETDATPESDQPSPVPVKRHHEIKPTFTPVERASASSKSPVSRKTAAPAPERSTESNRMKEIENAFSGLALNVRNRAGQITTVDLPGAGGGEAFAGYETAIFNAYYRAWTAPEDLDDRHANVDVKIVVARDGSIVSSEVVARSGHRELDRSVEQALRLVTKLPPFPESARDSQREFLIRFNLEAKLSSG
jgi:TonB family protein